MFSSDKKLVVARENPRLARLATSEYRSQEVHSSFKPIAEHYKENIDYKKTCSALPNTASVVAIHGGTLEPGTAELAKVVAHQDFSLYTFESMIPGMELRITSSRFDDSDCLEIVESSKQVFSIHGCSEQDEVIYVGGGARREQKAKLIKSFISAGFEAQHDTVHTGLHQDNICNKGARAGIQIELGQILCKRIVDSFCEVQQRDGSQAYCFKDPRLSKLVAVLKIQILRASRV